MYPARLLTAAATVALAAGLLSAPAASAAGSAVTDPHAVPAPGFASTGARTDACDDTTAPGFVRTTAPVLTARTTGTQARYALWDETTGGKLFDQSVPAVDGLLSAAPTGLTDGHTYAWRYWPAGGGKPTPKCHFRVDVTAPVTTVSSTDFPASGSGQTPQKYAGQVGTFTFSSADATCYRYVLNNVLGVGATCDVRARPDGSATVQIKPTQWGSNNLTVQAMDDAGNITHSVNYGFYAPWNPHPVSGPGDVDGDGIADILLPDQAGDLQVISTGGTGTTPSSVISAYQSPSAVSWAGTEIVNRGYEGHDPVNDLLVLAPGQEYTYFYRNFDQGGFTNGATLVAGRPDGTPGMASDWSRATQLVGLGPLDEFPGSSVLSVEDDDLWLFAEPGNLRFWSAKRLSTGAAWAGYQVIEPAVAADGSLTLRSRELATGQLREYAVPKAADGTYDFAALAAPAAGAVVGSFPVADYPTLDSSADGNLYAVTAGRHLLTFTGVTNPKDRGLLK
ncbi:hypothetical protein ACIRPK_19840 [Kitasatospora sp. NPDC101801]|uniref:hypothetical protein n=1 Tax=Kitasatospora sp. NPDC101801 TaxID=3364103 RepID=UPI0037FAE47A